MSAEDPLPPPSPGTAPDLDDVEAYQRDLDRRRRRQRIAIAAVLLLVLGGLAAAAWALLRSPKEAANERPEPRHGFRYPVDRAALGRIDHARVHAKLFPRWLVAVAHAEDRAGHAAGAAASQALQDAVKADRNLLDLLQRIRDAVLDDPWKHGRRLLALVAAWNDYLTLHGVPYEIQASVREGSGSSWLSGRFYHVLAALAVAVGPVVAPLRLIRRVDSLNLEELFLGHTTEKNPVARVVVDRTWDHAVDSVWPLLRPPGEPGPDPLDPGLQGFAPGVRAAVAAALPAAAMTTLERWAAARAGLVRVRRAIEARRRCGNLYAFSFMPRMGLDATSLHRVRQRAEASREDICPEVTPDEAADLSRASAALGPADAALRAPLEALAAWTARSTAIHELRHAVDLRAEQLGQPLRCLGCGDLGGGDRHELSAYLAAFADPDTGVIAVQQACAVLESHEPDERPGELAYALGRLLPGGCRGAVPTDVTTRARRLEIERFGARPSIRLPDAFPRALPLGR